MSSKFLNDVCTQILTNLNNTTQRAEANAIKGQLYIYDKAGFLSSVEAILNEINLLRQTKNPLLSPNDIETIKHRIENFHVNKLKNGGANINKRRAGQLNKLVQLVKQDYASKSLGKDLHYYYLDDYSMAAIIKSETAKELQIEVSKVVKTASKVLRGEILEVAGLLSGSNKNNPKKLGMQVGHGEYGVAVSSIKAYKALSDTDVDTRNLSKLQRKKIKEWKNRIETYLDNFELLLTLTKHQVVTKDGKLRASFIPILSGQGLFYNAEDAKKETEFMANLKKYFKEESATIEGSDTLIDAFKKVTLYNFINVKKDKRVKTKTKVTPAKEIKTKSTGKAKKKIKRKVRINTTFSGGLDLSKVKVPTSTLNNKTKATQPTLNLNALKAQINARLSMTVIKNMGTPALENRSGRFARSTQVTDVIQTSQGFPSIGYTYQKFPYQTFEPGFKQGSVQRDPRTLIDRSIREIASQLIAGRFYTRRT